MQNKMTLPLRSFISVEAGFRSQLLSRSEFGRLCIIGSSANGRGTPYGFYTDIQQVIAHYGMEASEYYAAKRYFLQSERPNPLVIATVANIKFKYFKLNGERLLDGRAQLG